VIAGGLLPASKHNKFLWTRTREGPSVRRRPWGPSSNEARGGQRPTKGRTRSGRRVPYAPPRFAYPNTWPRQYVWGSLVFEDGWVVVGGCVASSRRGVWLLGSWSCHISLWTRFRCGGLRWGWFWWRMPGCTGVSLCRWRSCRTASSWCAVAAYRERYEITDDDPLGAPTTVVQRRDTTRIRALIARAQSRQTPAGAFELAPVHRGPAFGAWRDWSYAQAFPDAGFDLFSAHRSDPTYELQHASVRHRHGVVGLS